jgi:GTP-binding protein
MVIHTVEFVGSFTREDQCPTNGLPEYAFIGRSNVGKSSLINMLVNRKNLAHTSSTPGKTQTLNYYIVNDAWYLVDLPGIGYARVSKTMREKWRKTMEFYFRNRTHLTSAFVLIDANIPPQNIDLELINQLGAWKVPFSIVFTKVDKGKTVEVQKNIAAFRKILKKNWAQLPAQFMTSAEKRMGKEELLNYIDGTNQQLLVNE